jgi:hypothetical protein
MVRNGLADRAVARSDEEVVAVVAVRREWRSAAAAAAEEAADAEAEAEETGETPRGGLASAPIGIVAVRCAATRTVGERLVHQTCSMQQRPQFVEQNSAGQIRRRTGSASANNEAVLGSEQAQSPPKKHRSTEWRVGRLRRSMARIM